ncbi:hypothetical protein GCM10010275_36420 [Streptomyces litmocidini]|nr:hypothetical protein GCM10010275_36420 [Streptomyces litmocidini]
MPDANVRAVHVLAPASRWAATTTSPAAAGDPAPRRAVPAGPVKTRETASAGRHHARGDGPGSDPRTDTAVSRSARTPQ